MPKRMIQVGGGLAIRRRRSVLVLGFVLTAVLLAGVAPAAAQTSDWTINQIIERRDHALDKINNIVADFTAYLGYDPNPWWTGWLLGSAIYEIEIEVDDAERDIRRLMDDRHRSDQVEDAGRAAIEQVNLTADAAVDTLNASFEAWLNGTQQPSPTTTTSAPPPTTTTTTTPAPPPTTTTTPTPPPTTTTTPTPPPTTTTTPAPPPATSETPPADTASGGSDGLHHRPLANTVDAAGDPLVAPEQPGSNGLILLAAEPPNEVQLPLVAAALRAVGRALPGSIVEPVFGLLVLLEIVLRALFSGIKSFWFLGLALAFLTGLSLRNLNRKTQTAE